MFPIIRRDVALILTHSKAVFFSDDIVYCHFNVAIYLCIFLKTYKVSPITA